MSGVGGRGSWAHSARPASSNRTAAGIFLVSSGCFIYPVQSEASSGTPATMDAMPTRNGREALRGAEKQTLDLIAEVLSPKGWAELLKGLLDRAAGQGNRGLAQKLAEPGNGREALRGAEIQTLDLISQVLTPERWADLLNGPLERAADQGNRGIAQKLVEAGAAMGDALHAAVQGGHGDVVNYLLDNEASIDALDARNGYAPLHIAVQLDKLEMVQLLMLRGADKDAFTLDKWTPLYLAGIHHRVAVALALFAGGADVSVRFGEYERSMVHIAATEGHMVILRALIDHGADVNDVDTDQRTALHRAAEYNKAEAIDVLVEAGASIDPKDKDSWTPLHLASGLLNLDALTALVNQGALVSAQDDDLETPLHFAAISAGLQGAAEAVDTLLRSGADETMVDREGKVVVDVVAEGVEEEDRLADDVGRVRQLLANAPADRAWRRRGYLVLCRARSDRMQRARDSSSAHAGVSRRTRSAIKLRRQASRCHESEEPLDWTSVVGKVLELQEEGIFRSIVGYL